MRLVSLFDRGLAAVAMTALFVMVLVTAVDVAGRTLFDAPLGFAYELIGVLLGVAVYAGLVGTNWRRDHICIDLMQSVFDRRPGLDRWRDRLSWVLEVTFFAVLGVMVVRQTLTLERFGERFYFLPLEKWVPLAGFGGLMALAVGVFALHLLRIRAEDR